MREGRGKKFCLSQKEVHSPKLINRKVGCKKDAPFSLCAACVSWGASPALHVRPWEPQGPDRASKAPSL